jgi:heme/copper-type cytochrome/quinol oxidase subunit 2
VLSSFILGACVATNFTATLALESSAAIALYGSGTLANIAIGSFAFGTGVTVLSPIIFPVAAAYAYAEWKYNADEDKRKPIEERLKIILQQKPLLIEIEPKITAPSVIDSRVIVSKFTWAVTLITHKGQSNESFYGNHAEIVVEGINDGYYDEKSPLIGNAKSIAIGEKFIHLAHLLPPIESGIISPDDLLFETRTEIWMRTSDKVKTMLENITFEKKLPRDQRVNFNLAGKDAYAHKIFDENGDNCFTWARGHLKTIRIDLKKGFPPSVTGFSLELVTDYTKPPIKYTESPKQRI